MCGNCSACIDYLMTPTYIDPIDSQQGMQKIEDAAELLQVPVEVVIRATRELISDGLLIEKQVANAR